MQPLIVKHFETPWTGERYRAETFKFAGGELQVKIQGLPDEFQGDVLVDARIQSSDDLMQLLFAFEILSQTTIGGQCNVAVPYFPYARQDRRMVRGEAFTLPFAASLVTSLPYDWITICDPHSDVTPALLPRVRVIDQTELIAKHGGLKTLLDSKNTLLIAPDGGSVKKTFKTAQRFGLEMITATKHRDVETGQITDTTIVDPRDMIKGRDVLIPDDICDGGRTFIELAKVVHQHQPKSVSLYVTHGIFSKGPEVVCEIFDDVFTTDSFKGGPMIKPANLHTLALNFDSNGDLS